MSIENTEFNISLATSFVIIGAVILYTYKFTKKYDKVVERLNKLEDTQSREEARGKEWTVELENKIENILKSILEMNKCGNERDIHINSLETDIKRIKEALVDIKKKLEK